MSDPATPPLERILARPERGARSIVDLALGRDPQRPPTVQSSRQPSVRVGLALSVHSRPTPVPRGHWAEVLAGTRRMYRTYSGSWRDRFARLFPEDETFPRPAVIYSQTGHAKRYDTALAVITAYRQEPLGAISPADLKAEGFATINHFRRYWRYRYVRWGYRPGDLVSVVQLRPWQDGDDDEQARWLLERLYGEWLSER